MKSSHRRRRGGWRRKGNKLQAYVRVHAGRGGLRTRSYPLGESPKEIQQWIDDTYHDYRKRHPKGVAGTLARDVETYLKLLVDRPRLQTDRATQLAWWCARFGSRSRWALQPVELETALNELAAAGAAASTVNKYRTALYHLYTKLDGKNAPNPLRDVPRRREADALPRALPYDLIDQILAELPTDRYSRTLTTDQRETIRRQARALKANISAIARAFGVSGAAIRKIRDARDRPKLEASRTRAVLEAMASLSWSPAMLRALQPGDYDPQTPSILARGRRKGGGVRPIRQPLTPRGQVAIERFLVAFARDLEAGRAPQFSTTAVDRAWRRAVTRLCDTLEADDATRELGARLRRQLADATPYSLRHSFLTEAQLATGNISATQSFALHADPRMTRRYTLAAVDPELAHAAALLSARFSGQPIGNQTRSDKADHGRKWPKTAKAPIGQNRRLSGAKLASASRK